MHLAAVSGMSEAGVGSAGGAIDHGSRSEPADRTPAAGGNETGQESDGGAGRLCANCENAFNLVSCRRKTIIGRSDYG